MSANDPKPTLLEFLVAQWLGLGPEIAELVNGEPFNAKLKWRAIDMTDEELLVIARCGLPEYEQAH